MDGNRLFISNKQNTTLVIRNGRVSGRAVIRAFPAAVGGNGCNDPGDVWQDYIFRAEGEGIYPTKGSFFFSFS